MSCYVNIYSDFPTRCLEVWERYERSNKNEKPDLSVTAMLMAASAGFAMPWEHLKHEHINGARNWRSHPSFAKISPFFYTRALAELKTSFGDSVASHHLFQHEERMRWNLAKCLELTDVRNVGEYGEGTKVDPDTCKPQYVLGILRNALSHNNICAFGGRGNEIDHLTFFSEDRVRKGKDSILVGWNVATTSVSSFNSFLKAWFELIKRPEIRLVLPDVLERIDVQRSA